MAKDFQTREFKNANVQIRESQDGKRTIEGLIPYNKRSEDMGFYEYIAPSAFKKTLSDGADVRALWNHDSAKLLGRVKNQSLRLSSDDEGLNIECDLPNTSYAEDVYNLIRDGYNTGMSFGFVTIKDKWDEEEVDGRVVTVCHLLEVRLIEVSFCVSFPAYPDTNSEARSIRSILDDIKKIKKEDLSTEERDAINDSLRELTETAPEPEPEPNTPAANNTEDEEFERQLDEFLQSLKS